ncbi:MAG: hypothetical protein ABR910_16105 [Acidobacteriaceae bacterium]|jgi:hypothetical protein
MARSVIISTPIPTLEEFGKSLGLSKRRQASLLRLARQDDSSGRVNGNPNGRHRNVSPSLKEKASKSKK